MPNKCTVRVLPKIAPRNSEGVCDCILASYDEGRYLQERADLAGCSLRTLKASENRLSTTFRILLKHDQICSRKSVVQTIMQTTVALIRLLSLFLISGFVKPVLLAFCQAVAFRNSTDPVMRNMVVEILISTTFGTDRDINFFFNEKPKWNFFCKQYYCGCTSPVNEDGEQINVTQYIALAQIDI